jgi:hypothetical protein
VRSLAYLDAASGSLVVSAIAGGIAGIAVVFKMGFRRFMAIFSPKQRAALKAEQAAKAQAEADAAARTGA